MSPSVQALTKPLLAPCLHVWLNTMSDSFVTPWTVACQAPLSMGFPRQEYRRGLPLTSPGALPNPGIEPIPLALADRFFTPEPPGKTLHASYKPKQITGPNSESVWRGIHKSGQWNGWCRGTLTVADYLGQRSSEELTHLQWTLCQLASDSALNPLVGWPIDTFISWFFLIFIFDSSCSKCLFYFILEHIVYCIYIPHLPYPFICQWTFRLLLCPSMFCCEHGVPVSLQTVFFSGYMHRVEMAGWHHRLDGHESEWTWGLGDGQGGLACCNSWGHKESDMTERLNWTEDCRVLR